LLKFNRTNSAPSLQCYKIQPLPSTLIKLNISVLPPTSPAPTLITAIHSSAQALISLTFSSSCTHYSHSQLLPKPFQAFITDCLSSEKTGTSRVLSSSFLHLDRNREEENVVGGETRTPIYIYDFLSIHK
jgi:hypothetical protein